MASTRRYFFIFLFILLVVIAVIHILGMELFWYWRFVWFDILVHTLAGLWVAGMVLWLYYLSGYITPNFFSQTFGFLLALSAIIVVGGAWEIFELYIGATYVTHEKYMIDTITDFVADIAGASIAVAGYFIYIHNKKENISHE